MHNHLTNKYMQIKTENDFVAGYLSASLDNYMAAYPPSEEYFSHLNFTIVEKVNLWHIKIEKPIGICMRTEEYKFENDYFEVEKTKISKINSYVEGLFDNRGNWNELVNFDDDADYSSAHDEDSELNYIDNDN